MPSNEEIERLRELHGMLEFNRVETSKQFQEIFNYLITEGGLTTQEVAAIFNGKFPPAQIDQWLQGQDIPDSVEWFGMITLIMDYIFLVCEGPGRETPIH